MNSWILLRKQTKKKEIQSGQNERKHTDVDSTSSIVMVTSIDLLFAIQTLEMFALVYDISIEFLFL